MRNEPPFYPVDKSLSDDILQNTLKAVIGLVLRLDDETFDYDISSLTATNPSFAVLYDIFSRIKGSFTILEEDTYVDRIYRDSYYSFYSGKHFEYDRYCRRLLLFNGIIEDIGAFYNISDTNLQNDFIGSIVIRPLSRAVGRTLINPYWIIYNEDYYVRTTDFIVNIFGRELEVKAFPYSMQDGETTSCAEITILNISEYYGFTYSEYHSILPSDIVSITQRLNYERRIPTSGLTYQQISRVFTEIGFSPRLYSIDEMPSYKFRHILHYYIESGIPIGIGLDIGLNKKHSVVGIGHGHIYKISKPSTVYPIFNDDRNLSNSGILWIANSADFVHEYCIMDDNKFPYGLYPVSEDERAGNSKIKTQLTIGDYKADYLMVPLYKRMYLEAADAYDICVGILSNSDMGITSALQSLPEDVKEQFYDIGDRDNPLIIRLFMASSRTMKYVRHKQYCEIGLPDLQRLYDSTLFPKFVWICELYSIESYNASPSRAIGEIVLDATSSPDTFTSDSSFIILHYPWQIMAKQPRDDDSIYMDGFIPLKEWNYIPSFNKNLKSPDELKPNKSE